jgi:Pentapeptide repeats (8 copies)
MGDPCPMFPGDGLCLAITWRGAAAGGVPAITGLAVAYKLGDVLGGDADKWRVKRCRVLAVLDLPRLIREGASGANLRGADLHEANLYGANLYGANLRGADLRGADLRETNLRRANLRGADLYEANLYGANLRGANLREADLRRALGYKGEP